MFAVDHHQTSTKHIINAQVVSLPSRVDQDDSVPFIASVGDLESLLGFSISEHTPNTLREAVEIIREDVVFRDVSHLKNAA